MSLTFPPLLIRRYICECSAGFTGGRCENVINFCDSNPCFQASTCVREWDGYRCLCPEGKRRFFCLSVCLSVCLSFCPGVCMALSVRLVCLGVCLVLSFRSVLYFLSVWSCLVCLSLTVLSVCMCLSALSVCLVFLYMSVCLGVCAVCMSVSWMFVSWYVVLGFFLSIVRVCVYVMLSVLVCVRLVSFLPVSMYVCFHKSGFSKLAK